MHTGGQPARFFRPADNGNKTDIKDKAANTNRLKTVAESVNELNATFKWVIEHKAELLEGYDPEKVNAHIEKIRPNIDRLATELAEVNVNLKKLRTSGGLISMVFQSGGVDGFINKLTGSIDELHEGVKGLMDELQKAADAKKKKRIADEKKKEKEPETDDINGV